MRAALPFVLLLAACATSAEGTSRTDAPAAARLGPDLFPFTASSATFADAKGGGTHALRVEPAADGLSARLVMDAAGGPPRELRIVRRGDSLFFAAGDDAGTELIRGGARPGDAWESDGRAVRFEAWESVALPDASVEAAKITSRISTKVEQVETWWFARGVGLVRLRADHGAIYSEEMTRTSP